MTRRCIPSLLSLVLLACSGSKISADLPDDTGSDGDGGSADGGSADGGSDGGSGDGGSGDGGSGDGGSGDGGSTGTDDDHDGWTVEAGDCNDDDDTIHPYADDECYDDVDADCAEDDDFDCDGDGFRPTEHGGEDCDDTNPAINPDAGDATPDGIDDDCDDEIDEDVCNVYAPLAIEAGYRTYDTLFFDGSSYVEQVEQSGWTTETGEATVTRVFNGGGISFELEEYWACGKDGTVTQSGYKSSSSGFDIGRSEFSEPVTRLLPQGQMIAESTWSVSYTTTDPSAGDTWQVEADYTVLGIDKSVTAAGTFTVTVLQADYDITDYTGYLGDRSGTIVYHLAPGIGVVYSKDTMDDGTVAEERELASYGGFLASDPAEVE